MKTRFNYFIFGFLVCSGCFMTRVYAQNSPNPSPEQLMQLMRSQPAVDISAPVTAVAAFDPPVIRPGERAVYRVTVNATAISVHWPEKIPAPPELNIQLKASGQTMQPVAGDFQNFAMFVFDVRAEVPGQFAMPEFTVQVYGQPVLVPATRLGVVKDLPEPHEPVRQLRVEPSATNVFVGESVNIRVLLPATTAGDIQGVSDVQLNGDGFVTDKDDMRQSIRPVFFNGRNVNAYVYETSITPIAAGTLSLAAQGFTSGMRFGGPVVMNGQVVTPGGPPQLTLLDSEPVSIQVRPLPAGEELPGYNGLVGTYICDPPALATNLLQVGEPALLTVVIRGQDLLERINPPPPPRAEGWQIFPGVRDGIVGSRKGPGARFRYTLIPLTTAVDATPAIPFSCFDPGRGEFVDLTIPSVPVSVQAGAMATNVAAAPAISEDAVEPEPKTGLSRLAPSPGWTGGGLVPLQLHGWFPLVQAVPVIGFCGLWWWDRRRRFLEQHPDIVRRRQALRALRRERRRLEQAAASGDAEKFVRHAISALQIASAPHFPATPRALVGGDVLQILTLPEREGNPGETVRRLFAAADAAGFANRSESQSALLADQSVVTKILATLEARL
ncbi:MAG TPA: hypothetical protein VMJ12_16825 [Candidatus Acidoferrales bacterium]|nr:hypothetical protein [Candidatus Acidoferrales bacterium]